MSQPVRRFATLALVATVALAATGLAPTPAAAADLTVSGAETEMVRLINLDRQQAGLVPVRIDTRLMQIARARSTDMATKHYFSHVQPDGRSVFDILTSSGITWYAAGEIIAWNTYPTLADSTTAAHSGWLGSPGHRAIILSTTYNYVGVGLALDPSTGKKLWTGVFMKGPDRTGGWVKYAATTEPMTALSTSQYRTVTVNWVGGDIRLVVLTAGFHHYQIQVRTDAGSWGWWATSTTVTSRQIRLWKGHTYGFRVRACDRAGNCGGWVSQTLLG